MLSVLTMATLSNILTFLVSICSWFYISLVADVHLIFILVRGCA
jgi:hypothetical protein